MGTFPFSLADPSELQQLRLSDLRNTSRLEFFRSVRPVCETIFYILLLAYEQALNGYYHKSTASSKAAGVARASTPLWVVSLSHAAEARVHAVEGARLHAEGLIDEAEERACLAERKLNERYVVGWGRDGDWSEADKL